MHFRALFTAKPTGLVKSYSGLLAVRFFLGLVEGPMLPGIVLYLSSFYTRKELSLRYEDTHTLSIMYSCRHAIT
jgi:MFS family permease